MARFHVTRFAPRVGLPRNLLLIGSLTAALRFSKGWVRKDSNLGLRTGRMFPRVEEGVGEGRVQSLLTLFVLLLLLLSLMLLISS